MRVEPWLPATVLVWFAGVAVFAFRPLASWYTVRRLRKVGVSPVNAAIRDLLDRTAKKLRLARAVAVLQSTLVKTPVVVGFFRPLILLPLCVVTGLPESQLELILAHELAHIRRNDYLVNLLQALVETLFFYHPAVWWLSRQIRHERENCCDDVAVSLCGNRADYGRALLAIEEMRAARPNWLWLPAAGGLWLAFAASPGGKRPRHWLASVVSVPFSCWSHSSARVFGWARRVRELQTMRRRCRGEAKDEPQLQKSRNPQSRSSHGLW